MRGAVWLITGIMASGKSTVAQALAERFRQSAHVRGDAFRRMVVRGAIAMIPEPSAEALEQLRLRLSLAASTADAFAEAGFDAVLQDVAVGAALPGLVQAIETRPLHVVVLAPSAAAIQERERVRAKTGYGAAWTVDALDRVLREQTPRIGLWLDTSAQTPDETVTDILARRADTLVS